MRYIKTLLLLLLLYHAILIGRKTFRSHRRKQIRDSFFLRQLKKLHVNMTLLVLFYKSIIKSIITFNLICYIGNLTRANNKKIDRPRKVAQRIIGSELPSVDSIYFDCI